MFSNHFNVLVLKIIFKKSKNIINMYFNTKNYLKNNHNYSAKQALKHARALKSQISQENLWQGCCFCILKIFFKNIKFYFLN